MNFRNIIWNLTGASLPLLTAALVIPGLLERLGQERFGLLALAWGLIGYAGVLDLGIGRATTQQVAASRTKVGARGVADIVATSVRLTLMTGAAGSLLLLLATGAGVYRLINAGSVPHEELATSLALLAFALPAQALSSTYRGVNEAFLNFRSINILRAFLGAANFAAPFFVTSVTSNLACLVATLLFTRCAGLLLYKHLATQCLLERLGAVEGRYIPSTARTLLKFGGWFTVSSVVSPLLVTADRFFIGSILSAAAVALYVIPYELTVQVLFLVGAITSIAFPSISSLIKESPNLVGQIFKKWLLRVSSAMLLITMVMAILLPLVLPLWVGNRLDPVSVRVGQVLCIGVFFNSMGAMYFSLLHGYGRTRVTALIHLLELPLYLIALHLLISEFGVLGAAVAWSSRMVFDCVALSIATRGLANLTEYSITTAAT